MRAFEFAVREHPDVRARKLNKLVDAVASSGNAAQHAADALAAAQQAEAKANEAEAAATAAAASAADAAQDATEAQASATAALASANNASAAADLAEQERILAESARTLAQTALSGANDAADAALAAAAAAAVSVTSAAGSASAAAGSANISIQRATEAELFALSASASANIAALKSDSSNASAIASSVRATSAQVSADESGVSAAASEVSRLAAEAASAAAGGSASAAATSATTAAASATAAGVSASASETSRLAAEAANTAATASASAASGSAATASAAAATATSQATLSATFAGQSGSSLASTFPKTMSKPAFIGANRQTFTLGEYEDAMGPVGVSIKLEIGASTYPYGLWCRTVVPYNPAKKTKLNVSGLYIAGAGASYIIVFAVCFDASGTYIGEVAGQVASWAGGSTLEKFTLDEPTSYPVGTAFIRFGALFNVDVVGTPKVGANRVDIYSLYPEDVTAVVDATAQASIAAAQAATATAQAASATASAILSASLAFNSLNKNPNFANWPGASGTIPADWLDWISGTSNTKLTGDLGGFAYRATNTAGNNQGIVCNPPGMYGKKTSGWFVMEADITVNSGNLQGVGLYIAKTGWTASADNYMHFKDLIDPATGSAYGAGILNYRYSFKKLIYIPEAGGTSDYGFYLMTAWGGFDATIIAHDVTWHRASIRDATPQEVRDQTVLAPLSATVSTHSAAIVDLEGRTSAYWEVVAVAGGRAQLRVFADANGGGGVDIVGDTKIDGDLLVTGSVTSSELAANSASLSGYAYNAASFALTTGWQDAAEVTLSMIGGVAKIDFAAFVGGKGEAGGSSVQWRLLRNGTEIRSGTLCLLPGEQTVYGGVVGENPYPVYTPITGMFPAFHLDTAGSIGSITFKVQVKLSTAFVDFADIAERVMTVTELRR